MATWVVHPNSSIGALTKGAPFRKPPTVSQLSERKGQVP